MTGTTRRASSARTLTEKDKLLLETSIPKWESIKWQLSQAFYRFYEDNPNEDSATFEEIRKIAGIRFGSKDSDIARLIIEGETDLFEVLSRNKIQMKVDRG